MKNGFFLAVTFGGTLALFGGDDAAWNASAWLSAADAPVYDKARDRECAAAGTSWFASRPVNAKAVAKATWRTSALGVYELYVNGRRVGADVLKPGFTTRWATRLAFTYDVTDLLNREAGATNALVAEVSAAWWRDHIARFGGKKSAFRGVLDVTYADGSRETFATNTKDWSAATAGPVVRAGIFEGEEFDARIAPPTDGHGLAGVPEVNREFSGRVVETCGAEVGFREDLALKPIAAYCWKGVEGQAPGRHGRVIKTRVFKPGEPLVVPKGQTLVVDFGQNAAAVPDFRFRAPAGTELLFLPAEALNEASGETSRGNDGPAGSVYRSNLRMRSEFFRVRYVFAGRRTESYRPRFTFFGYRYAAVTASNDVVLESIRSVPVSSVSRAMEIGSLTTGDAALNRLIANARWGQLSNYLSVPTDCPQRNERVGWTADTQVFTEAGAFFADTRRFFHKWMLDVRDTQGRDGCMPVVAPAGWSAPMIGWSDAGVIVPYQIFKQFADREIVDANWSAMERFMAYLARTRYASAALGGVRQCADWLSFEDYESYSGRAYPGGRKNAAPRPEAVRYWDYLGGAYWLSDARMMATLARATGRDAAKYDRMAETALAHLRERFVSSADGLLDPTFRHLQTAMLFALRLGLVEGAAREKTKAALRANFATHGDCLQTGFLGTSILLDTLSSSGMDDVAWNLVLQHKYPSWLYSVDNGATTIWEKWDSYTKAKGFGSSDMNSFNHYAYGSVVAWLFKTAAGFAADPSEPGFRRIVMRPAPDRRVGFVTAAYRSASGLVKSAWRYEGDKWLWDFTIPAGSTALVTPPGADAPRVYTAGDYHIERDAKAMR